MVFMGISYNHALLQFECGSKSLHVSSVVASVVMIVAGLYRFVAPLISEIM